MSLQVFFMASYNLDMFRRFVLSENFRRSYKLDDAFFHAVETDDLILMDFAFQFLRQALFGEKSTEEVENAWEKRVEERKEICEAAYPSGAGVQTVMSRVIIYTEEEQSSIASERGLTACWPRRE